MLQLQRASAGSGKTFTLAKKFIWFLISIKEDGKPWRLRNPREIADGLGRILAITFTNKATNEMKQRIVAKLADLSRAADEPVTPELLASVAYLKDFASDLDTSPQNIGIACKEALSALLNDYSAFRVSTIDSFFQSILRTFAYESNLNDSYQVEIDTDYLATAAIDATLDTVNNQGKQGSSASMWLRLLVDEAASAGSQWNVFQKSETPQSIYSRLRRSILRLESEEFKGVRKELDGYFDSDSDHDPLAKAYITLKKQMEAPLREALEEAQENCSRLSALLRKAGLDPKEHCQRWFDSHIRKLPLLNFNDTSTKPPFKPLTVTDSKPLLKKGVSSTLAPEINRTAAIMYEAYSIWLERRESKEWCHWCAYAPLLPYLGLLGEARKKMLEYLESNNMIQLGETNSMLKRIIGEDDTPFIYERLGTAINHYLIDEFQDTSRMQWDNLYPLLAENDSRGQDNLIIGDAKQSIYRFRNADPSLITTSVPDAFPRHIAAGMSRKENTNWRSDRRIVEFNNFFFKALVEKISDLGKGTLDFQDLYENVVQYPSHREEKGYVEIRFLDSAAASPEGNEECNEESSPLDGIGSLITSLLSRGYSCRDIALLVDTNQLGKDVIAAIVAYNATLAENERKIDFISEESLLVSSAEAVGIIISVLRKLIWGTSLKEIDAEADTHHNWDEIRSNFSFYSLRHPDQSVSEQISGFLKEDSPEEAINRMLSTMQTVALPALIEAITENFVPENLRRSQAVFIAALQDMVLEYCERYAADVASFLNWWDSKGKDRSISSPEGTDAVQIMTVHKAKGLEFKCVIMPFATASLTPLRKSEWRWVRPASCFSGAGLPPFIPIETTPALEKTEHAQIYLRYFDLYMMDRLNSIYVAFTRAVSELYIITKMPKRPDTGIGHYLKEICGDSDNYLLKYQDCKESDCMLPCGLSRWNDSFDILSFGEKPEIIKKADTFAGQSPSADELVIEEYGVDSSPSILQYVESDTPASPHLSADTILETSEEDSDPDTSTVSPEAADTDPRSEGNLLHSVMGMVYTAEDLPKALLSLKTRGLITRQQEETWGKWLAELLSKEEVKDWFDGNWKVLNERPVLIPHSSDRRPDRIMISPDRKKAIILDYKFGSDSYDKTYRRQVRNYISAFQESSGIRDVKGYLWYVRGNKLSEV